MVEMKCWFCGRTGEEVYKDIEKEIKGQTTHGLHELVGSEDNGSTLVNLHEIVEKDPIPLCDACIWIIHQLPTNNYVGQIKDFLDEDHDLYPVISRIVELKFKELADKITTN